MNFIKSIGITVLTIVGVIVSFYLSYITLIVLILWGVFYFSKLYFDEMSSEDKPLDNGDYIFKGL